MRKSIPALLLLAPALALASGYSLPNPNPRDLAMCASAVAGQVDSEAAFALPAALARIEGPSVRLGSSAVTIWDKWTDPTGAAPATVQAAPSAAGNTAKIDMTATPIPIGSVSYGGRLPMLGDRGWGAGVSFQPFGGAIVTWPSDWPGRYRVTKVDRRVYSGTATVALEVIPQVRLGGGLVYYYTTQKITQKGWMGFAGTPLPDATGTLDLSGGAASYDLSAEIDPLKGVPLTIAADYKHKASQKLSGDVTWSGLAPVVAGLPTPNAYGATSAKETLTIPNTLNLAAAYRVAKPLLVTGTFTFDRWIVYDTDTFAGNNGASIVVPRHYKNGQTYRIGAEYDLARAWQVRAGVQRDVSGLRSATYSPTLPDASSWGVSAGTTYRFGAGVGLDLGVFYAKMDKVTATNAGVEPGIYGATPVPAPQGTFRGKYDVSALIYGAALSWTPGAHPAGG